MTSAMPGPGIRPVITSRATMKWLVYGVAATSGLLRLAVAIGLLMHFSETFERIAIDVLVLIVVSIDGLGVSLGMAVVEQSKLSQRRFLEMVELMGSSKYEDDDMKTYLATERQKSDLNAVKTMIRSTLIGLTYFAGLWS